MSNPQLHALLRRILPYCSVLVISLTTMLAFGQSNECASSRTVFKQLDVGADVARNGARWITQDQDGFMWIGSHEGLFRFDGTNYKLYTRPSLGRQICDAICIKGDELYAGISSELVQLNANRTGVDSVHAFIHQIIGIDKSEQGELMVVNAGGLHIQSATDKTWKRQPQFINKGLLSILIHKNTVFIGSWEGLYAWNTTTDEVTTLDHGRSAERLALDQGKLWVASNRGMYSYSIATGEKTELALLVNDQRAIKNPDYRTVKIFDNHVYFGSDFAGCFVFKTDGSFCHQIAMHNSYGLTSDKIWDLTTDRDGNFWIATHQSGLFISKNKWQHIALINDRRTGKNTTADIGPVTQVLHISKDTVLLCSDGHGLMWMNPKTNVIARMESPNNPFKVLDMQLDPTGRVWLPTWNKGLFYYDLKKQLFARFDPTPWKGFVLPTNISGALTDDFGNIWITSFSEGSFVLRPQSKAVIRLNTQTTEGVTLDQTRRIVKDDDYGVYVKAEPLIFHYLTDPDTIKLVNVYRPATRETTLGISNGCSVDRDYVHFGSTDGVLSFTHDGVLAPNQWSNIASLQGYIRGIKDVPEGVLVTANHVLGYFHRRQKTWVGLDYEDVGFKPHFGAIDLSEELGISIGGVDQFMRIPMSFFNQKPSKVQVYIDDVRLNYSERIGYNGYREKTLTTKFTRAPMSVRLGTVNYDSDRHLTYQYRIKATDEYLALEGRTEFTLPQLDPGEYNLEIVATSGDGSSSTCQLALVVEPVFYQTLWFRLLAGIILVIGILGFIRWRLYQSTQARLALEQVIADRTLEISEQSKEIEHQRDLLQEGMSVGQYIQESLLPTVEELGKKFADAAVLFEASDTLSGDFYWLHEAGESTYIVAADCVGKGVSAALLTMIGINFLNTQREKIELLNLNEIGLQLAAMYASTFQGRDVSYGLDLTIAKLDHTSNLLTYCGASGKLLIKSAASGSFEIIKTDPFSINAHTVGRHLEFTAHEIQLHQGDEFHLFSDGCTNQLQRGNKAVPYGSKRLIEFMTQDHSENLSSRLLAFNQALTTWANDERQTDDRLMISFKIAKPTLAQSFT